MSHDGDSVSEVARMVLKRAREDDEEEPSKWLYTSLKPIYAIRRVRVPAVDHHVRYYVQFDDCYLEFQDLSAAVDALVTATAMRHYGEYGAIYLVPDDYDFFFDEAINVFRTTSPLHTSNVAVLQAFADALKKFLAGDIREVDSEQAEKKKKKTKKEPEAAPDAAASTSTDGP